ncbi:MAG: hypothetical protein DIU61_008785 [Bacteroidota bacterium]
MAEFEKEDLISDEALNIPNELAKAFDEVLKKMDALIRKGKEFSDVIATSGSPRKIAETTAKAAKEIEKLDQAQKKIITSTNEVAQYEAKRRAELKKTGDVLNENDRKWNKASARAAAYVNSQKESTKATKEATKSYVAQAGTLEALIQKRERLEAFIREEHRMQKEIAEDLKNGNITLAEYNEILITSEARVAKFRAQLADVNKEIKLHTILQGRDAKEIRASNASLAQLEAALAMNREAYRQLANEQERNSKEGRELLKVIQIQDKQVKDLSASMGLHQKNVGDYRQAITDALKPLTLFSHQATALAPALNAGTTAMKSAARGANILKVALIAIPIFALITAITSLVAYFTKTEKGAAKFRIAMAAVGAVFDSILDVLISIGEKLSELTFDKVTESLMNFGKAIVDTVVNQIKGFFDLIVAIRDAGVAAFTILKEKIKGLFGQEDQQAIEEAKNALVDAGKRAGESFIQATTGVDNLVDKIQKGYEKAASAVGAFYDKTAGHINKAIELQEKENQLILDRRAFEIRELALQDEIAKARERAADNELILEDRLEHLLRARELTKQLEDERVGLLQRQLSIEQKRAKLSAQDIESNEKIRDLQKEILQAQVQSNNQQRGLTKSISNLQLNIIQRDRELALQQVQLAREAAEQAAEVRLNAAKNAIDEEIALVRQSAIEGLISRRQAEREIIQIRRRGALEFLEQQITILQGSIAATEQAAEEEKKAIQEAADARIALLEEIYIDQPEKLAAARAKIEEETNKEILAVESKAADEKIKLEQKIHDVRAKFNEERFDQDNDYFEDLRKNLEEIFAEYQKWTGAISDLFSSITDRRIAELEREQEAVLKQRDALLEDEKRRVDEALIREQLTEEQKEALRASSRLRQAEIEEEFAKREEALEKKKIAAQRRLAIFEKAQAVTSALISTSLAVLKTFEEFGFPIGVPFAAAVGALGAIQVASIVARPIPQYAKGGKVSHSGAIIVGEEGTELMRFPSGREMLTPGRATLMTDVPAGTEIIPHKPTMERLAREGFDRSLFDRKPMQSDRIEKRLMSIERTIKNKPEFIINGQISGYKQSGTRVKYIESLRNRD